MVAARGELLQNYRCRKCGTSFTADHYRGDKLRRSTVDQAVAAVKAGHSIEQVVQELRRQDKQVTNTTVRRWLRLHAPELVWTKQDSAPLPGLLEKAKTPPADPRVPSFGLNNVASSRRLVTDREFTAGVRKAIRGRYSAYSDEYHSLYSFGRYDDYQTWAPTMRVFKRTCKKLGIPEGEVLKHVTALLSGRSGQSKPVKGPFPVKANGGFAFLLGLFYASGGIGGNSLHFAVDLEVAEYLRNELAGEVRERPAIVKQGSQNRAAHGTYSVTYSLLMLDVLKKFGLKIVPPIQLGRGKWVPSRYLMLGVPYWVRREPHFLHRFVEGYLNGIKLNVGLEGRMEKRRAGNGAYETIFCTAKVNFCSRDSSRVDSFAKIVTRHLRELGVKPGYYSRTRTDGRPMQHTSYSWHTLAGLSNFANAFRVLRPNPSMKISLRIRASSDPVLRRILTRTSDLDNHVLGRLILEGPKSEDELAARCPRRPYNATSADLLHPSIQKLSVMGAIVKGSGKWRYDPAVFAKTTASYYRERVQGKEAQREEARRGGRWDRRAWDPSAKRILGELEAMAP